MPRTVTSAKRRPTSRRSSIPKISRAILAYGRQPLKPEKPKLPTLLALIHQCRPAYGEPDVSVQAAAARILGTLYRHTHAIYKPDDNARARAVQIYQKSHPAAAA